jgi:hypothetical protein
VGQAERQFTIRCKVQVQSIGDKEEKIDIVETKHLYKLLED